VKNFYVIVRVWFLFLVQVISTVMAI